MVKQVEQQQKLHKQLWAMANDLRGNMDANSFKDYILGLIFYRYLSETLEKIINEEYLKNDSVNYQEAWENEEYRNILEKQLLQSSSVLPW